MTKKWYTSKTVWINLSVIIAAAITNKLAELIQPYIEIIILAIINLVLRTVTRERIKV